MGFRDKKPKHQEAEEKTIEINAEMQGSLSFKDSVNLKINGEFSGSLDVRGNLTIGSDAKVQADINGDNVIIAGNVQGNVFVNKMLTLMPTAILKGDITTPKLNIVEGALFEGFCRMGKDHFASETDEDASFWNLDEVSRYLEIEQGTIVQLAHEGKIPAMREGEEWRFDRTKIDEWASSGKL